jgi:hypothetical protein
MEPAARSIAFFSRQTSRAESSMTMWAAITLLVVLALLVIGGPS